MKKYLILFSSVLILFFVGCDGVLILRGYVVNDDTIKSHFLPDSLTVDINLSKSLEGVQIQIDPAVQDSLISQDNLEKYGFKTVTDSLGYFEFDEVVAPFGWTAGLIAYKIEYVKDTIFFSSAHNGSTLIISLKEIK